MSAEVSLRLALLMGGVAGLGQQVGVAAAGVRTADTKVPQPSPKEVYRVGAGVTAPKPVFMPDPEFYEEARRTKISGNVLVRSIVEVDGNTQDVYVARYLADI